MPGINMMPSGSTLQIPLDACTGFSAKAGNAKVELTWTDPKDKYATPEGDISDTGDQLVSEWDHTVLVRKTGSQPAGPNDGTVVVSSSVRNQYQSTPYTDTGLTNDTTYYYAVFAYNKDGVASEGAFTSATPIAGTPLSQLAEGTLIKILENGSPVEFYLSKHSYEPGLNGEGRELLARKDIHSKVVWNSSGVIVYAGSTIDTWQNRTYKSTLSGAVQSLIGTTSFYSSVSGNSEVAPLERAVFSLAEHELYNSGGSIVEGSLLPIANTLKFANYNGSPANWYTRTPYPPYDVTEMHTDGKGWSHSPLQASGVRPCFTLPATALVDQDLNLIET